MGTVNEKEKWLLRERWELNMGNVILSLTLSQKKKKNFSVMDYIFLLGFLA